VCGQVSDGAYRQGASDQGKSTPTGTRIGAQLRPLHAKDPHHASLRRSDQRAATHVDHLLTNTAARDRAQLVIIAYETGLVTPVPPP